MTSTLVAVLQEVTVSQAVDLLRAWGGGRGDPRRLRPVDVIHEEATEDNLKMAATSSGEMGDPSAFGVARRRLPWL